MAKLKTLSDLFLEQIRDLYDAENQLVKALPKMAKAAEAPELKEAFEKHCEQTKGHVERLKQICAELDEKPTGMKCKAMEGLIKEGEEMIEEDAEPTIRDAGLIAAAQRVEHYEMAAYGCSRTFAELLGHEEAVELLQETLDEETETDESLTELAETVINPSAVEISEAN